MKLIWQGLLLFLLSVFFMGVHAQHRIIDDNYQKHLSEKPALPKKSVRYGIASFYAKKFQGRKTANGQTHQQEKYSAACNVFPFDTWIKVTNLKNNKAIIVKIIDRLHAKSKRLIDLSLSAAQELDYITSGITSVKVEMVDNSNEEETEL